MLILAITRIHWFGGQDRTRELCHVGLGSFRQILSKCLLALQALIAHNTYKHPLFCIDYICPGFGCGSLFRIPLRFLCLSLFENVMRWHLSYQLLHGYFAVKNPGQPELDEGLSNEEAREKEEEFFHRASVGEQPKSIDRPRPFTPRTPCP